MRKPLFKGLFRKAASELRRRVVGIETEYGLLAASTAGHEPPIDADQAAMYLFSPLTAHGQSSNLFLRNGGRLYLDVGSHPEYATAECDQLGDLLSQNRAGDRILSDLAAQGQQFMEKDGIEGRIHLFRNNVDSQGNSYGCHENYMLHRRRDFHDLADVLVSFLITRLILVGSGHVRVTGGQGQYVFSQRADHMWDAVSSATTRSRPIINTRDEPLGDSGSYRRLHVIVGDTNVAEPTTALKVGATMILLSAIEDGLRVDDLVLADPTLAIREINNDLTGSTPVDLVDGRQMSAVQIQAEILRRLCDHHDSHDMTHMDTYILDLWQRGLNAIQSGDWSGVDTELDFAIKKALLDRYRQRTGAGLSDPRVARLELAYHDIAPDGLQPKMEQTGLMRRMTTDVAVDSACVYPPPTTRAALRGRVIAAAEDCQLDVTADWVHIRLDGSLGTQITLNDPLSYADQRVDDLVDYIVRQKPQLPTLPII